MEWHGKDGWGQTDVLLSHVHNRNCPGTHLWGARDDSWIELYIRQAFLKYSEEQPSSAVVLLVLLLCHASSQQTLRFFVSDVLPWLFHVFCEFLAQLCELLPQPLWAAFQTYPEAPRAATDCYRLAYYVWYYCNLLYMICVWLCMYHINEHKLEQSHCLFDYWILWDNMLQGQPLAFEGGGLSKKGSGSQNRQVS